MNHFTNSTCFPVQSIKKKGKHGKNFINVRKNYEKILHIFGLLLKKVKLFNYVTLRQEQNMCNFLFKPYNKIINAPSEKQPSLGELMNQFMYSLLEINLLHRVFFPRICKKFLNTFSRKHHGCFFFNSNVSNMFGVIESTYLSKVVQVR